MVAMKNPNYVAVNEQMVGHAAGAIVWWRMQCGVSLNALTSVWQQAGLNTDLLPNPPSPADALRRACLDMQSARLLMRPLGRGKGFAVVRESIDDENESLNHRVLMTVNLDANNRLVFKGKIPPTEATRNGMVIAGLPENFDADLEARYIRHKQELSTHDVSQWVIRLLDGMRAVGLRQRGGIYFVPNPAVGRWNDYIQAIKRVSDHRFFSVPAMQSDSAVEAILDAVEREAQALADQISKELTGDTKLGKRALQGRQQQLMKMEDKLTRYEELMGKKSKVFPGLKLEVDAGITKAIMALDDGSLELPLTA